MVQAQHDSAQTRSESETIGTRILKPLIAINLKGFANLFFLVFIVLLTLFGWEGSMIGLFGFITPSVVLHLAAAQIASSYKTSLAIELKALAFVISAICAGTIGLCLLLLPWYFLMPSLSLSRTIGSVTLGEIFWIVLGILTLILVASTLSRLDRLGMEYASYWYSQYKGERE